MIATKDMAARPLPAAHLLVIGERQALRWILESERMAFPKHRDVRLGVGDQLLLYTTRGCFHNPTRDRGRVIGVARVTTPVQELDPALEIADRRFTSGCRLRIDSLAEFGAGVDLSLLVDRLNAFPDRASWSVRMRRVLVPLDAADARLLKRELGKRSGPPRAAKLTYYERIQRLA